MSRRLTHNKDELRWQRNADEAQIENASTEWLVQEDRRCANSAEVGGRQLPGEQWTLVGYELFKRGIPSCWAGNAP